jgi:hypothetical protein
MPEVVDGGTPGAGSGDGTAPAALALLGALH